MAARATVRSRDHQARDYRAEMREVLAAYGLAPQRFSHIKTVVKVDTSAGGFVLKRSRLSPGDLWFVHSAQEHLHDRGFAGSVRYAMTLDGRPYASVGGRTYVLAAWAEGRSCDFDDRDQLALATRTLAAMHEASRGFALAGADLPRVEWGAWPSKFAGRLSDMRRFRQAAVFNPRPTRFDRRYAHYADYFMGQGEKALDLLSRSSYAALVQAGRQAASFCHHDYSHRNVLLRPDGSAYLVDFDYCICDIRVHDVASLMLRNLKATDWEYERALFVLREYDLASSLCQEELEAVMVLLVWPQEFWRIAMQYYDERQPWTSGRFMSAVRRRTANVENRDRFLRRFAAEHRLYYPW